MTFDTKLTWRRLIMLLTNCTTTLMIIMGLGTHHASGQDQKGLARKDSLSRLSYGAVCVSVEPYLVDSVLLISETYLPKVMRGMAERKVRIIRLPNDSTIFYLATKRTIILNGVVLTSSSSPVSINRDNCKRMRMFSEAKLLKKFGILNENGGLFIVNKLKQ